MKMTLKVANIKLNS